MTARLVHGSCSRVEPIFFFLVFHSLSHPNIYNSLWNSVFLAFLMFKSEIVRTVEEIGPKVMLVNYFITDVLCSHHLLFFYWSNGVLFHSFHPSNLNVFFSGFRITFCIRFYWHCCAPHLIYVYPDCYSCSRVLCICCFGHFWAIGEPIFHYETNKIAIKKRIKFHFTVIQNKFVKLIGNVWDH